MAALIVSLAIWPTPVRSDQIIVIGDSWALPIGFQLRAVLAEEGITDVPVEVTPYWGGPRNFDSPQGFEAIEGWLEKWPDANFLYMMMGQNNWLCCWDTGMIGSQEEADLFESIIGHTENVVNHIWSIRPGIRIVWTAGEYFRPHHLGTPPQINANHERLAALALDYAQGVPGLTFIDWNGHLQVTYGFDGVAHSPFDPDYEIPPGDPSLPDPGLPSPNDAFQNAAHPTIAGYRVLARALYDRYLSHELGRDGFHINAGLSDAWYNPETAGQGFVITVFPVIGQAFMAWFTFDLDRPDGGEAELGDPGHRWLTAQGPYAGNRAVLDLWITEGGRFDSGDPPPEARLDGEIILEFSNCNEATVTYSISSAGREGTIPIERVAGDNIALCEALDHPP